MYLWFLNLYILYIIIHYSPLNVKSFFYFYDKPLFLGTYMRVSYIYITYMHDFLGWGEVFIDFKILLSLKRYLKLPKFCAIYLDCKDLVIKDCAIYLDCLKNRQMKVEYFISRESSEQVFLLDNCLQKVWKSLILNLFIITTQLSMKAVISKQIDEIVELMTRLKDEDFFQSRT